jgi:hypothetical protein
MSLLDSIKRWFGARQETIDDVAAPGPERAGETLERERRERAADPRPSLADDEGYEPREEERER